MLTSKQNAPKLDRSSRTGFLLERARAQLPLSNLAQRGLVARPASKHSCHKSPDRAASGSGAGNLVALDREGFLPGQLQL